MVKMVVMHNVCDSFQFNSIQYLLVQLFSKNKHGKLSCSHEKALKRHKT